MQIHVVTLHRSNTHTFMSDKDTSCVSAIMNNIHTHILMTLTNYFVSLISMTTIYINCCIRQIYTFQLERYSIFISIV